MVKCIYCGKFIDPTKGEGDHIISVQLGEFRNDHRFRRICPPCNNKIGRSEQQFLRCGPESLFRDVVNPKVPPKRRRGRSHAKAAMGVPGPESTIDLGDHRIKVIPSIDNPINVLSVDQIVIHDDQGQEYFIKLFPGMRTEQLKDRVRKKGINKIAKTWLHCDENRYNDFKFLFISAWPNDEGIQELPVTEVGVYQITGRTAFMVTDHYFRAVAKIGFHYYLVHSRRGFHGDEECFTEIRDFIMNGGDINRFFRKSGPKFVLPFGELKSGGVVSPKQWCHFLAADETDVVAVVYVNLFVGRGCLPPPNHIHLANINSKVHISQPTWGHTYIYDEATGSDRYAGRVEQAEITRCR